uniref:Vps53 N-terminal domain-containing protein n=1 Tax=Glossina palpalis gambiensis TaxID=67801 RepID=A0A1B0APU3_9MUSC
MPMVLPEVLLSLIDDNIRSVVREQTNTGQDGQLALCEAQKAISTLYEHIIDVKTRAERTEEVVKDITRDIKQLDCAKRNLISAITTLNHLHMLVGGIESLKILIENCLYDEILNLLQAITEVNQHFQQSSDIEEIKNLSQSVDKIQISLTHQITEDLKEASSVKTVIHVWILISCFSGDLNNSNNNNNLSKINLPSPYAVMPVSYKGKACIAYLRIGNRVDSAIKFWDQYIYHGQAKDAFKDMIAERIMNMELNSSVVQESPLSSDSAPTYSSSSIWLPVGVVL